MIPHNDNIKYDERYDFNSINRSVDRVVLTSVDSFRRHGRDKFRTLLETTVRRRPVHIYIYVINNETTDSAGETDSRKLRRILLLRF